MSIEEFIEDLKIKKNNFSEIELIRYVYCFLGKRFYFDALWAFGSNSHKQDVAKKTVHSESQIKDNFQKRIINCKSLSYIVTYILRALDINTVTLFDDDGPDTIKHAYNRILLSDNMVLDIDLEKDLHFIQANARSRYFGESVLSREELEVIDKKIGYISDNKFYTDDYLYLMKDYVSYLDNTLEKVSFILDNLDVYDLLKDAGYIEYRAIISYAFKFLLTDKDIRKTSFIDIYNPNDPNQEAYLCIVVTGSNNTYSYYLKDESGKMNLKSLTDISGLLESGLVASKKIPGLKFNKGLR